jgi:TPR repeat protein
MLIRVALLTLLILFSIASLGQTSSDFASLRAKAEAGDAKSQNAIAYMYRTGDGVDKNLSEAFRWYSMAARHGDSNAMFNLGTHYYNGDGVPTNDVLACAWFWLAKKSGSKAAENAAARAEHDLSPQQLSQAKLEVADMLAEGKLVPRDSATALAVYEEAGRYGKPDVQLRLAKLFMNAWGVPQDDKKAEQYCRKALELEKDYTPALLCIGFLYQSGRLGPGKGKEAFSAYEKAFSKGNPVAAYGLGVAYATGNGVKLNDERALEYLVIAALSNVEVATPLAKQVEQKLRQDTAKKIIKKANAEKASRNIFEFGVFDRQFAYVVKVDHLP